jgi:lactate dehydrogenase-like 2-hydroxyacid dehydrogenase
MKHLFPGDDAEHAAVILAGWHRTDSGHRLLARDLIPAAEPRDYRLSISGFNALQPTFIHRAITSCRDRRLAYLAVHNHGGSGSVAFSSVDLASHERGYPALRDIAAGMPVGALVVADGAMELDLWLPDRTRVALEHAEVIGERRITYYASQLRGPDDGSASSGGRDTEYARQELFLGERGQALLREATVAVVGLGGVGSIVNELLARLGVGRLVLIDPDCIEPSNLSRIVGATAQDASRTALKTRIAERVARQANPAVSISVIAGDVARHSVARALLECNYIFLAADSMRSRLVFNAIVN